MASPEHAFAAGTCQGHAAAVLSSTAAGGITATFVPDAGLVGCSLTHRGEELLGQRGGLARYVAERSTMGIPLLHPWANRLSEFRFELAGREVALTPDSLPLSLDPNGLPIHGLLAGASEWELVEGGAGPKGARILARFDFAARDDLVTAFPFPHELTVEIILRDSTTTFTTTLVAGGEARVPVSFGYHPYFRLPGVPRNQWSIEVPVREQLLLDERNLPTGERVRTEVAPGPLGSRTFDDVYAVVEHDTPFVLEGGGRRIEARFREGYPIAVVYAPENDDVVCFEPMTAPPNALVDGAAELELVEPGGRYSAAFSITVADA